MRISVTGLADRIMTRLPESMSSGENVRELVTAVAVELVRLDETGLLTSREGVRTELEVLREEVRSLGQLTEDLSLTPGVCGTCPLMRPIRTVTLTKDTTLVMTLPAMPSVLPDEVVARIRKAVVDRLRADLPSGVRFMVIDEGVGLGVVENGDLPKGGTVVEAYQSPSEEPYLFDVIVQEPVNRWMIPTEENAVFVLNDVKSWIDGNLVPWMQGVSGRINELAGRVGVVE